MKTKTLASICLLMSSCYFMSHAWSQFSINPRYVTTPADAPPTVSQQQPSTTGKPLGVTPVQDLMETEAPAPQVTQPVQPHYIAKPTQPTQTVTTQPKPAPIQTATPVEPVAPAQQPTSIPIHPRYVSSPASPTQAAPAEATAPVGTPEPSTQTVAQPTTPVEITAPTKTPITPQHTVEQPKLEPVETQAVSAPAPQYKVTKSLTAGFHLSDEEKAQYNDEEKKAIKTYLSNLPGHMKRSIDAQWHFEKETPASALSTVVSFTLDKTGTPSEHQVAISSGNHRYDEEVLHAIQGVQQFPSLPDAYKAEEVSVIIKLDYQSAPLTHGEDSASMKLH